MSVGPTQGADGTSISSARIDKQGAAVVIQRADKYGEDTLRGVRYGACDQSGTAPGTALGTTAHFTLYNPQGSGKRLRVHKVSTGYISGTLGAGTLFHCINNSTTQTAPSSGTLLTSRCLDVGITTAGVAVARTGGTVVQPVAIRPFCSFGAELASTVNGLQTATEDVDGDLVIEPGCSYQLQAIAAAGTTPLLATGVSWEEEAIV